MLDQDLPVFPVVEKLFPRRFWWLKRMSIAAILFVLLVCGLRWWAICDARRRLDAEIEALRSSGDKVLPADFVQAPIPEAENAAVWLRRAYAALDLSENDEDLLYSISPYLPLSLADRDFIGRIIAQHPKALPLIESARGCKDANWGIAFRSPVLSTLLPDTDRAKLLAHLAAGVALLAHEQGNDAEAVERVRDILAIARAIDREPFVVSHQVSVGIAEMAAATTRALAPALGPLDHPSASGRAHPATREQVLALMRDLMDDAPTRQALQNSLAGERMIGIDAVKWFANVGPRKDFTQYFGLVAPAAVTADTMPLFRPVVLQEARQMMRVHAAWIEAFRQPDAASAMAMLPTLKKDPGLAPMSAALQLAAKPVFTRHYQSLRSRRQAAILLAEKLYLEKHRHPASSIDGLVPEFLPVTLDDPMSGGKLGLQGLLIITPPASRPSQ